MKKSFSIALGLLVACIAATGCGHATCDKIEEACGGGEDAVDDCIDDYRDGDADCRKAMRELAKCVDEDDCGDLSCVSESIDVLDEC